MKLASWYYTRCVQSPKICILTGPFLIMWWEAIFVFLLVCNKVNCDNYTKLLIRSPKKQLISRNLSADVFLQTKHTRTKKNYQSFPHGQIWNHITCIDWLGAFKQWSSSICSISTFEIIFHEVINENSFLAKLTILIDLITVLLMFSLECTLILDNSQR